MDEKLATKIREALTHTDDVVATLAAALSGTTSPMTVRDARNSLSEVLRRARSGDLQLIGKGKPPGDLALVISIGTFADLPQKARTPLSFGDALHAAGFRPATGAKPKLRRPHPRNPPKVATRTSDG